MKMIKGLPLNYSYLLDKYLTKEVVPEKIRGIVVNEDDKGLIIRYPNLCKPVNTISKI